jgi:hypothetical protein
MHRSAVLVVVALLALVSPSARASQLEFDRAWDAGGLWIPRLPSFLAISDPVQTDSRTVGAGTLPLGGSTGFLAVGMRIELVYRDRLVLPIGVAEMGFAVVPRPNIITRLDGTVVSLSPGSASYVALSLPGIGVRGTHRRVVAQIKLEPSIVWVMVPATLGTGAAGFAINPNASTFALRAEGELCWRADPTERVCLYAAVNLYQFGAFNGGAAGVRWEWGH